MQAVIVQSSRSGETATSDMRTTSFSGRVYIYNESELNGEEITNLTSIGAELGLSVSFRGHSYCDNRNTMQQPLAFISHDSKDKDEVARPLAQRLQKLMCPVWFDEFSLKVGDSLRESIEKGIKECKKCILILSPNFLSNKGWTKTEFNSVFTREILSKENVILPVWHGVNKKQVYEYSPSLADKIAANWEQGIDEVTKKLYQVIKN